MVVGYTKCLRSGVRGPMAHCGFRDDVGFLGCSEYLNGRIGCP